MASSSRTADGRSADGATPSSAQPGRRTTEAGPPACARSIASFASASATLFWARGTCAADQRVKPAERLSGACPERDQLRVLHPPATGELLDDELGIEQQVHLGRPELARQLERADDPRVLGDVVGLDPEVVGDRRVGGGPRVARVGRGAGRTARRPADAGPGLPRAAPSVRIRNPSARRARPTLVPRSSAAAPGTWAPSLRGRVRRTLASLEDRQLDTRTGARRRRRRGASARPIAAGRSRRRRRVP